MNASIMNASSLLQRFNTTIQQWIDYLDDYTLDDLCKQPRQGSWSLGQVYRHIIDDTGWFAGQMKAALATDDNRDGSMHPNGQWIFRNDGFPDTMIEGPATNTFIPQPQSKEELRQGLMTIREEVNGLASGFERSGSAGKTEHPGFRFFTALEWLQFAEMHMRHHFRQKKRIDALLT